MVAVVSRPVSLLLICALGHFEELQDVAPQVFFLQQLEARFPDIRGGVTVYVGSRHANHRRIQDVHQFSDYGMSAS